MALPAGAVIEVRQPGSDANGGGFNPANANFPTDGTVDTNTGNTASPVFSSATYNFVAGDVSAWLYVKSGTNTIPGWYQIASVASNKATLTASIGSGVLADNASLNTVVGIATVGTPTSITFGIDYSQQDAAEIAFTDMVIDAVTNTDFTSVANLIGKNLVGNYIRVVSGTGFTVQTVEVVSTTLLVARCDKSLGTLSSTGGNGNLGGALATPGMGGANAVAGNVVFIKYNATPYDLTTASTNVAGGSMSGPAQISSAGGLVIGYDTTRIKYNFNPNRPTQRLTVNSSTGFQSAFMYQNLIVDGNTKTGCVGFSFGGNDQVFWRCHAKAVTTGFVFSTRTTAALCTATTCTTYGLNMGAAETCAFMCEAYANTCPGFLVSGNSGVVLVNCISSGNTGASSYGFYTYIRECVLIGCTAYGNSSHGFFIDATATQLRTFNNCLSTGNGGYGFSGATASSQMVRMLNCATYNNTSGATNLITSWCMINNITLSGDPFTNAAGGDFSLNNTAGAGASVRNAGYGIFPRLTSVGYPDIGAVQHLDTPSATNIFGKRGSIMGAR